MVLLVKRNKGFDLIQIGVFHLKRDFFDLLVFFGEFFRLFHIVVVLVGKVTSHNANEQVFVCMMLIKVKMTVFAREAFLVIKILFANLTFVRFVARFAEFVTLIDEF